MSFGINNPGRPTEGSTIGEQFSVSGGSTQSSGYSQSQSSQKVYPDKVWPEQAKYLLDLYQSGQQMAGVRPRFAEGLLNTGAGAMEQMLTPGGENPQLQAYMGQVQRNMERNVLPALGSQAIGAGGYGGARHDLGRGLAASDANQQITDMASALYGADMDRAAGLITQGVPALANLGLSIPWYGLQQYGGLLGSPVVLDQGSKSKSSSYSSNQSSGSTFGRSYGYDVGRQTGGGGGGGFNIGI